MEVKVLRFELSDGQSSKLGRGDVEIPNVLVLRDVNLIKGQRGYFISPPRKKSGEDYFDVGYSFCRVKGKFTPKASELVTAIQNALIEAYQQKSAESPKSPAGGDNDAPF